MRSPLFHLVVAVAGLWLAGCMPPPEQSPLDLPGDTPLTPRPLAMGSEEALAVGPSLVLDDVVFETEEDVLEQLEEALGLARQAKQVETELTAKLRAETQRAAALEAQAAGLEQRVSQLTDQLKTETGARQKSRAELEAATTALADLEAQLEKTTTAADNAAKTTEELKKLEAENGSLRDKLLQAELARVKAQQDLIALQIVMARQQALLKRRPVPSEAKAPATAPISHRRKEATP
jgi:hypothetical protein